MTGQLVPTGPGAHVVDTPPIADGFNPPSALLRPDPVNHPSHYGAGRFGCECIAVTRLMPFTVGNAVKYIWRHAEKNGVEDLRKALVYLDWAVEDRTPVAINVEANEQLRRLIREHVRPFLQGIDSVYGAIYRIAFGDEFEARALIVHAIEELDA